MTDLEIREVGELVASADRAVKGEIPLDDGVLQLDPHFLRAPDGRTYVPFSLIFQDWPEGAFSTVALYIRVAQRGDRTTSADRNREIGAGAAVPVFAFDAAAGRSARLLLDRPDRPRPGAFPFEAAHFTPVWWSGALGLVRRAFQVRPGAYDVYIVVREREGSSPPGRMPRTAVLRRTLEIPDLAANRLAMSTPILAARLEPIAEPLDPDQQAARPYALGTAEIVPAVTSRFRQSEACTVVFLVYNAASDAAGKPDVEVEYRFVRAADGEEVAVKRPLRVRFDRDSLPANFDLRAGHQIVPAQMLPLELLPAGPYRLELTVIDRITSQKISQAVRFSVIP